MSQLCSLCHKLTARYQLPVSGVWCCVSRANRCEGQPGSEDTCFYCKAPATKKTKKGFVCGTSIRGCLQYEKDIRSKARLSLEKHYAEDPEFREDVRARQIETNRSRYGTDNPRQSKEVSEKIAATNLDRYGCISPAGNKKVRDKIKATLSNRYNVEYPGQLPQTKDAAMRLYGVKSVFQLPEVKSKILNTIRKRYGVDNVTHLPEYAQKSSDYAHKSMILPSGNIVKYQGFENFSIQYLLNFYPEEDLKLGYSISIPYKKSGRKATYYPDICLEKEKRLIEVKSDYTYKASLKNGTLMQKLQAAKEAGWLPEVHIWDSKGIILRIMPFSELQNPVTPS